MKKIIFSSLIAMAMLSACQNETKKEIAGDSTAIPPPPPIENTDTIAPPLPPTVSTTHAGDTTVHEFVKIDKQPSYPGGVAALYKFLGENIKYPAAAIAKNVQGNVFLSFIVEEDGSLSNIKTDKKLGFGTDEEAIRVLGLSKKWNPGMHKGQTVRAEYKLPVKFTLAK